MYKSDTTQATPFANVKMKMGWHLRIMEGANMANIKIHVGNSRSALEELSGYHRELIGITGEISRIRNSLSMESLSTYAVKKRLDVMIGNINDNAYKVKGMRDAMEKCIAEYSGTENRILGKTDTHNTSDQIEKKLAQLILSGILPYGLVPMILVSPELYGKWDRHQLEQWMKRLSKNNSVGNIFKEVVDSGEYKSLSTGKFEFDSKKKKDYEKKHSKRWINRKSVDENEYDKHDKSKKGTIWGADASWEDEKSKAGAGVSGKLGKAEVYAGKIKKEASINAGVYVFERNGKKFVTPAVEAALGGSFSLIGFELASKRIGNDNVNMAISGGVDVGKVNAKATGCFSVLDKNGRFNPEVSLKGELEALAFEARGKGEIDVMGIKGNVEGSVNFGIGAHAKIGYEDGVFACDIGASLGLGGSVAFEVDTTEVVNAVVSGAKQVGKVTEAVYTGVKEAGETAGKIFDGIGKTVRNIKLW